MNSFKLNKVYNFKIKNFGFAGLTKEECANIFKDGRVASHFLEVQLTKWFPELTHVKGCKEFDHIDTNGEKYDAKNFTKGGLKFMPSNQIGTGRKFNFKVTEQKAKALKYICCDIVDFPDVRVKFIEGADLIRKYPSAKVSKNQRKELFGE